MEVTTSGGDGRVRDAELTSEAHEIFTGRQVQFLRFLFVSGCCCQVR